MKLSDMIPAEDAIETLRQNPKFRKIWDESTFARDVAIQIVRYRADHDLSQSTFGQLVGMEQSAVARLENGERPPSLKTLAQISAATGLEFHVAVIHGLVELDAA